jgi:hypothetical protein
LDFDPQTQLGIFAVAARNVAVPVDFAIVGKLAQTLSSGGAITVPFETQAFQCLDSQGGHGPFLSFSGHLVMPPLVSDPNTQLDVFVVAFRNITVPVNFAIVGKLAQTVFPP